MIASMKDHGGSTPTGKCHGLPAGSARQQNTSSLGFSDKLDLRLLQ